MSSNQVQPVVPTVVPTRTSRCAIASLVLAFLSCPFSLLASIPGVIFGIIGLRRISRSEAEGAVPRLTGRGLATTGLVLSALATLAFPVMVAILLPAVQAARNAATRVVTVNNLKQLSLAMLNAEMSSEALPAGIVDDEGKGLLSWRVAILPYLGNDEATMLFKEFHLDEPWDSEHNSRLISRMPAVFTSPNADSARGLTDIVIPVGPGAAFGEIDRKMGLGEGVNAMVVGVNRSALRDGSSMTVLMMAVPGFGVPWTKPSDMGGDPVELLAALKKSGVYSFPIAMCDGSVRPLSTESAPANVRAMFTRDAGDRVIFEQ
jgi:hypothetical protein